MLVLVGYFAYLHNFDYFDSNIHHMKAVIEHRESHITLLEGKDLT